MAKENKGSNDWGIIQKKNKRTGKKEWFARIVRLDGNGKPKQFARKADNKAEARRLRDSLASEYDQQGEQAIEGNKLLFRELCDIYEKRKLQKAEYVGEGRNKRKVKGKRSLEPSMAYLAVLKEHFGAKPIKNISHDDVEGFKELRLATPTKRNSPRSIVDVNRSLEHLRAILRFATRQGWLTRTPFEMGTTLISKAEETQRERTLSRAEEVKLIKACGKRRTHLIPIIKTALDTAMRRGELFKLKWSDVDFDEGTITILATNAKTEKERLVGMTPRVKTELKTLWNNSPKNQDGLVFGIKDTIKTAFASACKDAGIEDLRFHDFRHTAVTRMIEAGLSPIVVQKVSGHSQFSTFKGYVNPDKSSVVNVAKELSKANEKATVSEDKTNENGDFIIPQNEIELVSSASM